MLTSEVLETFLSHQLMREFDMESQAQIMQIFEDVLFELRGEIGDATISELLD